MPGEVEQFYTVLREDNAQFLAAQKENQAAQEKTATVAEETAAKQKASTAKTAGAWSQMGKAIRDEGSKTSQVWQKVTGMGKVAAVGLVAMAAVSTKWAADFGQEMELVHTQAGAAQSEVDALSKSVLALAPTVGIGPEKLAEGLYHIESTGLRGAQALNVLTQAARLTAIGLTDMDTVTYAMSGVMAVGMKDIHSAADAISFMNATVGMGDMRMEKLTAAISTGILPSFKSAGLGMRDFSAALATLSDNSVPADEAATRLRMTVALMTGPSNKAAKALESIGLKSSQLAKDMRGPGGLLAAVLDLKEHLEKSGKTAVEQNEVIMHAFGGGRSSSAILTLIEESDKLKSKYVQLGTAASRTAVTQDAWAKTQQNTNQQLKQLGAEVETLGIKAGQFVLPVLTKIVGFLASHESVMKGFFVVLVAGMTAFTIAVIANTIAMLANPVVWIVLAIVAAVALLALGIYELVKHWSTVWAWIKRIAGDVWGWLVSAWKATWNVIKGVGAWIESNILRPIGLWFQKWIMTPVRMILNALKIEWKFAWGFLSTVLEGFKARWLFIWGLLVAGAQWAKKMLDTYLWHPLYEYGVKPLERAITWLGGQWAKIWAWIVKAAHQAWLEMKVIWRYVDKYGITPIHDAISWLGKQWDKIWGGIRATVDGVWKFLKPIFDKIGHAISTVIGGLKNLGPGKAGQMLAHFLGFADGGWVPGPPGAPMLAVVHGGEFVVSRDMQSGRVPIQTGPPITGRYAAAGGSGGDIVIHNHTYLDGREIYAATIRHSQRDKRRNAVSRVT